MVVTPAMVTKTARVVAAKNADLGGSLVVVRPPSGPVESGEWLVVSWGQPRKAVGARLAQKPIRRLLWDLRNRKVVRERPFAVWSLLDAKGDIEGGGQAVTYYGIGLVLERRRAERLLRRYPDGMFVVPFGGAMPMWDGG